MEPEEIKKENDRLFMEAYKQLCLKHLRLLKVVDREVYVSSCCTSCEVERNYMEALKG